MPMEKLSITLRDAVLAEVDARGERGATNRSGVITRDLDRYYTSLRRARRTLRETFSEAEMAAILDNLNGVWMAEPVSVSLIYANVEDGLDEGLAEKWKIDGRALVEKLRALSLIESCALADAAERWWRRVGSGEQPDVCEILQ